MKRIEDVYIKKKIIIGTESRLINSPELETHKWKFYIRGLHKEDKLNYISKVVITLHETFPQPVRILTYPFIIEEKGWGEFTIFIKIFFDDLNEKHVSTSHFLKLFNENDNLVISERVETIVFKSPSKKLYDILVKGYCEESESNDSEGRRIDSAIEYMIDKYEEL